MTRRLHTPMESPVGPLTLVATDGVLFMVDQRHRPPPEAFGERDPVPFREVIDQMEDYSAGERTAFDLPLSAVGIPFQREVWAAERTIAYPDGLVQ